MSLSVSFVPDGRGLKHQRGVDLISMLMELWPNQLLAEPPRLRLLPPLGYRIDVPHDRTGRIDGHHKLCAVLHLRQELLRKHVIHLRERERETCMNHLRCIRAAAAAAGAHLVHSSLVAQLLQRRHVAIRHIRSPAEEHQSAGPFSQGPPEHLDPALLLTETQSEPVQKIHK